MDELRIAIVDDSSVMRRLLADVIGRSEGLTVAGTAKNGRLGVELVDKESPDAVILDIEMPEMNGLEALAEIRKRWPDLPVIMFSTLAQHGAEATMAALTLGASDYVAKPASKLAIGETVSALREQVTPLLRALCDNKSKRASKTVDEPGDKHASVPSLSGAELVVVGASTGGPVALAKFLGGFPKGFPLPIVVVQHMPALFSQHLATQLGDKISLPVQIAGDGDELGQGGVWIAPGGHHLVFAGEQPLRLSLNDDPPVHSCRPAVDVLFHSAAAARPGKVVGVVLTGMGHDGLEGARSVKSSGGTVFAQSGETSVVWGMPGAVVHAGLAQAVGSPEYLARLVSGAGCGVGGAKVSAG